MALINNKDFPTTWDSLPFYRLPPKSLGKAQTSLWGQILYYTVPNIFLSQKLDNFFFSKSIKTASYLLFKICPKCTASDVLKISKDYSIASSHGSLPPPRPVEVYLIDNLGPLPMPPRAAGKIAFEPGKFTRLRKRVQEMLSSHLKWKMPRCPSGAVS